MIPSITFTPQVEVKPPPPPIPDCTEIGRVTRANVSGYQRARIQNSRLVRGEQRCLVANFNGAIDPARTIASVTWRCEQPYYVAMANARIPNGGQFANREAAIDITAQLQGLAWIKCEATMDNGEIYTQAFTVCVIQTPYFYGEAIPVVGPYTLAAQAVAA